MIEDASVNTGVPFPVDFRKSCMQNWFEPFCWDAVTVIVVTWQPLLRQFTGGVCTTSPS